ncbi:2852_t:CDS:1, partial [Ambispora gerdemannii]
NKSSLTIYTDGSIQQMNTNFVKYGSAWTTWSPGINQTGAPSQ